MSNNKSTRTRCRFTKGITVGYSDEQDRNISLFKSVDDNGEHWLIRGHRVIDGEVVERELLLTKEAMEIVYQSYLGENYDRIITNGLAKGVPLTIYTMDDLKPNKNLKEQTRTDGIDITSINPEQVEVFHDDDGCLGRVNEYEFNDLRIQIMRKYKDGDVYQTPYYVLNDDKTTYIDKNGRLIGSNCGFFRTHEQHLRELLRG